jgi:ribonucleoside-diphosphate reductase alpha chain
MYGPQTKIAELTHAQKYRQANESFYEAMCRMAAAMSDDEQHRKELKDIFLNQRFMPAGRIQSTVGSARKSTPFNCFVSGVIEDNLEDIMDKVKEAALTMKRGGGIGYDFSRLRPKNSPIVTLDSFSSGPISFMDTYDTMCQTIMAAGHRRGAMMSVLRVDHPDIEEFVRAKQNKNKLTNFNISVGITDKFMRAVENNEEFELKFEGKVYKKLYAPALWDEIMRATWDWAEPGVLFLDHINDDNNLYYCETIEATNPCGEQPLPPYGACLLGSFNLTKYIWVDTNSDEGKFNWDLFYNDIPSVVKAVDNVIDIADFPLPEQHIEALQKRRMGLGITGLANVLGFLGLRYGSEEAIEFTSNIMIVLRNECYRASINIAKNKGPFPLFMPALYAKGKFIQRLPSDIQEDIYNYGIRNSHLISIAPTGTISFTADNISSGIEPTFAHTVDRTMLTEDGHKIVRVKDYAYNFWGVKCPTVNDLNVNDHLNMLMACVPYVDSAISKTINIEDNVSFEEFKGVYMAAWKGKAKGVTTFRVAGKRFGILNSVEEGDQEGLACFIDPTTGTKSCE